MNDKLIQKFENYQKALAKLNEVNDKTNHSDIEITGYIQRFIFTLELGWKTIESILEFEGNIEILRGSKDVIRLALKREIIKDGELWMEMLNSRNYMSHVYDDDKSNKVFSRIKSSYLKEFESFEQFVLINYKDKN